MSYVDVLRLKVKALQYRASNQDVNECGARGNMKAVPCVVNRIRDDLLFFQRN